MSRCRKGNNQRRATCCTVFVRGGSPIELRCKPPPPTYTGNPFFSPRSAPPPSSVLICTRPAAKEGERKKPLSLSGAIQQTCGNRYADLFCQPHIWRISIQRKCRGEREGLSREDFSFASAPVTDGSGGKRKRRERSAIEQTLSERKEMSLYCTYRSSAGERINLDNGTLVGALQKKSGIPAKESGGQTRGGPIIFCDFDKTPPITPSDTERRGGEDQKVRLSLFCPLSLFACVSQREIGREIRNWK